MTAPRTDLDPRYGEEGAGPTPWDEALAALAAASGAWLTTLAADGRPHTTPLITVVHDGAVHLCTGPEEVKARNLARDPRCQVLVGSPEWDAGLDVVVDGEAVGVTDEGTLRAVADAYREKYGDDWSFTVADGAFHHEGGRALVFRVAPRTAHAFGKAPHSQTRYRF